MADDQRDRPMNWWLQGTRELPEDRPCTGCGRSAPEVSFGMRKARGRFGQPRRKSRCRECESAGSVESRRRSRQREREASES